MWIQARFLQLWDTLTIIDLAFILLSPFINVNIYYSKFLWKFSNLVINGIFISLNKQKKCLNQIWQSSSLPHSLGFLNFLYQSTRLELASRMVQEIQRANHIKAPKKEN